MAHRKTQEEAKEVKAKIESDYPNQEIVIKNHPRGGYLIVEARVCEECGEKFTTTAIGEIEIGGTFCRNCKAKVYEQLRQERQETGAARRAKQQAYYDAEYYPEEG